MHRYFIVTIALVGVSVPSVAAAETPGVEDASTMSVTIVIPPLRAAVNAQAAGATGLWSIVNGNSGLMINSPKQVTAGGNTEFSLFGTNMDAIQVTSASGVLKANPVSVDGNASKLQKVTFNFAATRDSSRVLEGKKQRSQLMVISTK